MEKTVKMYIEIQDGSKMEQDVPQGLVDIYLEKGWKIVEETKKGENPKIDAEETFNGKPFFESKRSAKFKRK